MGKSAVKRGGGGDRSKQAATISDWAVRDLEGPPPGPVSRKLRERLLEDVCEELRVHAGRGARSPLWNVLGEETIVECAQRVVIGGETAQAVARAAYGVTDPNRQKAAERKARRLQDLLSRVRRMYVKAYSRHRRGAEIARKMDEYKGDLSAVMESLSIKIALRLDSELDPDKWDESDTSERHLLVRMLNTIIASTEVKSKADKLDADAEKIRQTLEAFRRDVESGKVSVSPEDQGYALLLVTRGVKPTPEAIAALRREKAVKP